jgi:hypothetical protein
MSPITIPHTRIDPPDHGLVPQRIVLDGVICPVIAAVFLPVGVGQHAAHIVAYRRDMTDRGYCTGLYVHDDDAQRSRLVEGAYDLTLAQALRDVVRRLED